MFVCRFEEYVGFGGTLEDAWENLRVAMEHYDFPEMRPEDCRFFKEIQVEFDIQEVE